ncbi:unnamed protein product, partial [marine sediment metagenome]
IMKESGQLIKKTVSKDERAWFFSFRRRERRLYPSGFSTLGKIRVFSYQLA